MGQLRLGVDIGGTFTDVLLADETGVILTLKTPSVPDAPEKAIMNGLEELKNKGVCLGDIDVFIHGTTLGVNTLIERKGCKTGLLVTKGFRDILEIRRLRLENTIDLYGDKIVPLVARQDVEEINERIMADGSIKQELNTDEIDLVVRKLKNQGIHAIAISFLHSYKNPEHEQKTKEYILRNYPDMYVSASSDVWPQQKEYERTLVTVINSYIGEKMRTYFQHLIAGCKEAGLKANVLSTMSNGGIMTAESAAGEPVKTLLSGPASGVIGAMQIARELNIHKIITFDMGGTSADVSIIDGTAKYSTENKIGDFPVIIPAIDVTAIGAGGGSIAWVDNSGILKVGPASAGAKPGPASYNRGGTQATTTDAYVSLGFMSRFQLLNGEMEIFPELAQKALDDIGSRIGLSSEETAQAIIDVATANMYAQFIPLMAKNGVDPRDYALLAYGGAGPTHAFILAREVGIQKVIVPPTPGTLCAMGSAFADLKQDYIYTSYKLLDEFMENELKNLFMNLRKKGEEWINKEASSGVSISSIHYEYSLDMRYDGQAFELKILLPEEILDNQKEILKKFYKQYRDLFGIEMKDTKVAVINIRVTAVGETIKGKLSFPINGNDNALPERRKIYFDHHYQDAYVIARDALPVHKKYQGPAIITAYDTTVFVPAEYDYYKDSFGNVIGEMHNE